MYDATLSVGTMLFALAILVAGFRGNAAQVYTFGAIATGSISLYLAFKR